VELAHLTFASHLQACYSWNSANHSLKSNPCHFKILVPCLGHISMLPVAMALLPAVQICPIRHSPMGWNSVWNVPATDQEWIGVEGPRGEPAQVFWKQLMALWAMLTSLRQRVTGQLQWGLIAVQGRSWPSVGGQGGVCVSAPTDIKRPSARLWWTVTCSGLYRPHKYF
jgi:hypothetical protein